MTFDEWTGTPRGSLALTLAAQGSDFASATRALRAAWDDATSAPRFVVSPCAAHQGQSFKFRAVVAPYYRQICPGCDPDNTPNLVRPESSSEDSAR